LENRDAFRDQALGATSAAQDLDVPARYEVHLDRKLERTLAMLIQLRELTAFRGSINRLAILWQLLGVLFGENPVQRVQ
jgi:hypothetical protein